MTFSGITVDFKCSECGTDFSVDVEGTEREHLPKPGAPPLRKMVSYRCPKCDHPDEMTISLGQTPLGQG